MTYPIQISLHGFYYFHSDFQASIFILRTFFMYNFCFMVQWGYSLAGFRQDALQVVICWPMAVLSVSLPSSRPILTSLVDFCVICIVLNVGHNVVVVVFMCVLTRDSSDSGRKRLMPIALREYVKHCLEACRVIIVPRFGVFMCLIRSLTTGDQPKVVSAP